MNTHTKPRVTLTTLEAACLDTLTNVLAALTGRAIGHWAYQELMGEITALVKRLTNKKYGCASGKHTGPCACQEKVAA